MVKSYRVQLVCRKMDHAKWVVMDNLSLSLAGVLETVWEFDCPVHGPQHEKPLQAEEKRELSRETTKCNVEGCAHNSIGVLDRRPFCRDHFIFTCQVRLQAYQQSWKEQHWLEVSLESVSRFIYNGMREAVHIEQNHNQLDEVQRAQLLKIIFSAADLGSRIRRSPRKALIVPIRLVVERAQNAWEEETETVLISRCGALVRSQHSVEISQKLRVFQHKDRGESPARVVWCPPPGDSRPLLAFELLECDNFWGLDWSMTQSRASSEPTSIQ